MGKAFVLKTVLTNCNFVVFIVVVLSIHWCLFNYKVFFCCLPIKLQLSFYIVARMYQVIVIFSANKGVV